MNNQAEALIIDTAAIPQVMKERPQWVVWRSESRDSSDKRSKFPYVASDAKAGRFILAASNNPETWATFSEALEAVHAQPSLSGIGYCFSDEDGLAGIDLDHCFDRDGNLLPWAKEIVDAFADTYKEKSPSGEGLHIWCFGKAVKAGRRVVISRERGVEEAVEIYDSTSHRYFTVTGNSFKE